MQDESVWVLEVNTTEELMMVYNELKEQEIKVALFNEPDLCHVPSICFLASEEALDKKLFPDASYSLDTKGMDGRELYEARKIAQNLANKIKYGEKTAFLREISYRYKFATN